MTKNNWFILSTLLLASCAVGPDYKAPGFLSEKQIAQSLELKNTTPRVIPEDWYKQFNDQTLNYLIAAGLEESPNVAAAIRRLRQARAELNITKGNFLPDFNLSTAYKYDKPGKNIGYELKNNYYQAGLDAEWELDIWGAGRRQTEAAQALFKAAAADLDNVRVTLVSEIARTYIGLRTAQEQLRIARKNLQLQTEISEMVEEKYKFGLTDTIALNQSRYAVETTKSLIPALEQQIAASENALAVLTGVLPGRLAFRLEPVTDNLVSRRFDFPIDNLFNIPAEVVRARPDVRGAEQKLVAQNAAIGEAVAKLYPDVSISAMFGYQSIRGTSLFTPRSEAFSWSPSITMPIFHWGQLVNNVELQKESKAEYVELYRRAVLSAVGEIKDSMSAIENEYQKNLADYKAEKNMREVMKYTLLKYRQGLIDFSDMLIAEQDLLKAQTTLIAGNGAIYQNIIAYYKAIGGGYQPAVY